ncbi:MAG TPA: phosphonate ABC transporter, permease protein PhnE [Caulobacteraceae bacterium]|nr:phosphonate ABC transporter, permease protein PhnE [Caulobacteraceae bacterium]
MTSPAIPSAPPPPPTRALGARVFDLLLWGGIAAVLVIGFMPTEMFKATLLFRNSENMRTYGADFTRPDWANWAVYAKAMWLTIEMALWGTFLAVVIAIPMGLLASRNIAPFWIVQPMRWLLNAMRAVPDLVIGVFFTVAVGLSPFAGVMALALNTGGVLGKLFSEAVEAVEPGPIEGVRATGATRFHEVLWGVIPQVGPLWTSYGLYRFESNARSATILGLIGAGGIGQLLFENLQAFAYREVSMIAVVIVVAVTAIDTLSQLMRKRLT